MYKLRQGSIFDQKCDLVIIPCNDFGGISHSIASDLIGYGLPTSIKISNPGEVTFEVCPKHFTLSSVIGYSPSVPFFSDTDKNLHNICAQIIKYCINNSLRLVNIPLLGTGAGGLSYQNSFDIIRDKFKCEKFIEANIYALSETVFNSLKKSEPQSEPNNEYHPRVFISYTGYNSNNKKWVENLCLRLRQNGVDARCDIFNLKLGYDLPQWMTNEIEMAEKVLLICDKHYLSKIDYRRGGVGWETMIIQGGMLMDQNNNKFICIMREDNPDAPIPSYMRTKYSLYCSEDEIEENKLKQLLMCIFDCEDIPPIAPIPQFIKDLL